MKPKCYEEITASDWRRGKVRGSKNGRNLYDLYMHLKRPPFGYYSTFCGDLIYSHDYDETGLVGWCIQIDEKETFVDVLEVKRFVGSFNIHSWFRVSVVETEEQMIYVRFFENVLEKKD